MTITATGIAGFSLWDNTAGGSRSVGTVTAGRRVLVAVWYWKDGTADDPLVSGDLTKTAGTSTVSNITLLRQDGGDMGGTNCRSAVFRVTVTGSGTLTLSLAANANSYGGIATEEFASSEGWDDTVEDDAGQWTTTNGLTTYNSGDATSAGAALFFGALIWNSSGDCGISLNQTGSGWVSLGIESDGNNHEPGAGAYRIVSSGTTDDASWNGTMDGFSYNGAAATLVVLKETASSGVTGTFASTLAGVTSAFSGSVTNPGTFASTLAGITSGFNGSVSNPGTFSSTLAGVTAAFSGSVSNPGTFASTLAGVSAAFSGTVTNPGTFASTLEGVTASFNGTVGDAVSGTFASTLQDVAGAFSGAVSNPGSLAPTLDGVSANFSGNVSNPGTFASTLAGVTGAFSGSVSVPGTFASTLGGVTAEFSGSVTAADVTGTFASVLEGITASFSGQVDVPGGVDRERTKTGAGR